MDEMTKQRTLRASQPLWAETARISVRTRGKPSRQTYHTIVVGAGISGALVAQAVARPDRPVLVIDRRKPLGGSTMASTAMIQHEIDIPLTALSGMIGVARARRAWQRSAGAVLRLERLVRDLDIACSFERRATLLLAGDEMDGAALGKEAAARRKAGLAAEHLDADGVDARFGLKRDGGIVSDISASANPAQLAAGLLRAAAGNGAEIVSEVEITDVRSLGDRVAVATSAGALIEAAHVVFCTGYEFLKPLESRRHAIVSTWAFASRPKLALPDWLADHIVWEASDPYLYFRLGPEGRLIIGGEDEESSDAYLDEARMARKAARVREKFEALTGIDMGRPAFAWSAAFGTTDTGLPFIDTLSGTNNVHAVMGFGGNGITFSQIASEIIAARIDGHDDPDADLFRFPTR
ncbi:Glycine/D-amino acid oxidase [Rhizobium sp. RU20A]|uniref:NAD(P)/FAD-dependent oxidoreductase n=1 Tax=Rhizobium sp. RU20A TaxID=1907412 RepID=UPI000954902C|nr:FAD-binding oxidoreductase [Rhizobium sp. RU20A]SIR39093.1 Glycine/D-amino acid oxidase [Rhizobium sp. RU20A]